MLWLVIKMAWLLSSNIYYHQIVQQRKTPISLFPPKFYGLVGWGEWLKLISTRKIASRLMLNDLYLIFFLSLSTKNTYHLVFTGMFVTKNLLRACWFMSAQVKVLDSRMLLYGLVLFWVHITIFQLLCSCPQGQDGYSSPMPRPYFQNRSIRLRPEMILFLGFGFWSFFLKRLISFHFHLIQIYMLHRRWKIGTDFKKQRVPHFLHFCSCYSFHALQVWQIM